MKDKLLFKHFRLLSYEIGTIAFAISTFIFLTGYFIKESISFIILGTISFIAWLITFINCSTLKKEIKNGA